MKDINLNKTIDSDAANANMADLTETVKEDINKNEKILKPSKDTSNTSVKIVATNDISDPFENSKDETDKVSNLEEQIISLPTKEEEDNVNISTVKEKSEVPATPPVFVPKYRYLDDQWSPLNKTGKKCYDVSLLKQMKDDPLSKNKPNVPLLEAWNLIRTAPMQEPITFAPISRTMMPPFFYTEAMRNNAVRDPKKDGRNIIPSGKGSVKLTPTTGNNASHKPVIHVSLSLREDVKLKETENAWKPARFKHDSVNEDDAKTQDLYKNFRGILNKLTPQKFDTLIEKVKLLEIDTQKRLEGVIDLVFEKAIDEPNFSEAYAAMCNKLSTLKVPLDNASSSEQCVNFRGLIISKCQSQFQTAKIDEQILKLEKEIAECTDSAKKKELYLLMEEESRRVRMRSVGNVRFIGELYKLKMLTAKIMFYCMNHLIDKAEEEKLECLCKLLTTIGEQVESEIKEQLDNVFKKMQDIVSQKSNKISSRVRFMIQDVIALRKRKWVTKSVVDLSPKMMDQIQKEAEEKQRHIELMNANPMGFRREEGGRGKRGDARRQNSNSYMDNNWKTRNSYSAIDTSKLKAVSQNTKNVSNTKLAPHSSPWNQGSGAKNTPQVATNVISLSKNKFSALENLPSEPTYLRTNKDVVTASYAKGASIERSTFHSRSDMSNENNRSATMGVTRSNSGSRSVSTAPGTPTPAIDTQTSHSVPQEPLTENKRRTVMSTIQLYLINHYDDETVVEIKQKFSPQDHSALITEILNIALEKSVKEIAVISKLMLYLVSTNTISSEHFLMGMSEIADLALDLYIDIPMLDDYLGKYFIAPQIEKKHVTFKQTLDISSAIISAKHGHLLLKAIIGELKESMGPSFVKSRWQESEIQLKDWMDSDQVAKWVEENHFQFIHGESDNIEESNKILTPTETHNKLLQLMNSDENYDCIKGWVQDKLGKTSNEDWFMRALIQAICEQAISGAEHAHLNQDKMQKYSGLINEFGESREAREASCLFGIQQLIDRLEHPQGLTLDIFQYLHEQYLISVDGFLAWEISEKERKGKGIMLKALTSFFTNIKEADNEDSGSED